MDSQDLCNLESDENTELHKQIDYLTSVIDKKEKIIIEINGKISRIEKLNKEMENVIRRNYNLVSSLSSELLELKVQIKEMLNSGKKSNNEAIDDEQKFTHDKRISNTNFGKWLHKKKIEKNRDAFEIKNIKQVKLMNSRVIKKCEKLTMKENDVNYNNLISHKLFELCKVDKYHRYYNPQLIHLSFLLYRLSSSGFELLRKYLPFPSHAKIYEHVNMHLPPIISSVTEFNISKIPHSTIILASKSKIPIPVCLGIDAVCVVASSKYTNLPIENLYSFLQPPLPQFKCIPVRLIECKSGIGNKDIVNILIETSKELSHLNFSVHF